MESLVDIINQLQDVFAVSGSSGIDLPQIVVVGSQSAGKSSVLEHIVGKSFLPRGTGIVTRCPLVLQLVHAPEKKEECAFFQHNKDKQFTDYNDIRKEIEEQTARIAGDNKGICNTTINLKIYSPSLLNLTLVDLPGLTKVPVGDQPWDIEVQIKELIYTYINNPNSIILAVTPANVDMATSESLKIAKEVDPQGIRTLAVLTKLDLMDDGTDAWDMLNGKVIPVKLGIIGVVNRSQKDIMDEKTIKESLKSEAEFFAKNYKSIADSHGSHYLTNTVQEILVNHIRSCMPDLKDRINQKLLSKQTELSQYVSSKLDDPSVLLELIARFSSTYVAAIKGDLSNIQTKELYGGARINFVFQDSFSNALKSIDPLAGLEQKDIMTAMKNSSGVNPAIFVPEVAFELLVKKQIETFRKPSLKCVNLVYDELRKIARSCIEDTSLGLDRYPKMKTELDIVVNEILKSKLPITKDMVQHFIDIHIAYVNTSHPDFLPKQAQTIEVVHKGQGEGDSLPQGQLCINLSSPPPLNKDKSNLDYVLIQELIKSYFSLISTMVQDSVPKVIMHFLVNFIMKHLQMELVKRLYKIDDIENLVSESPKVIKKRQILEVEVEALEEAYSIINSLSSNLAESITKSSA